VSPLPDGLDELGTPGRRVRPGSGFGLLVEIDPVVDLPARTGWLVAVLLELGLEVSVGVTQTVMGAKVPGADHLAARQLTGGDPTLPDGTCGHRDADLDVGLGLPEAVVANKGRAGRPTAVLLQMTTQRPQRLALGGGQVCHRHAGSDAQQGLGVALLHLEGVGRPVLGALP
jgi:hypothetical protein